MDGRNRLLACREAGQEPRFVEWLETFAGAIPVDRWIWSLNVERRHLTPDQIAWAVVQRRAWEEEKSARDRQVAAGKQFHKGSPKVVLESPQPLPPPAGKTRTKLAKESGVSEDKIRQALAVQKLSGQERVAPELAEQLKNGAVKLRDVIKRAEAAPAAATRRTRSKARRARAQGKDAATPTKRQQAIQTTAKRRMVEALSQLRGVCRGLSELNMTAVRHVCTAEETATWAAIARNAGKELRLFSSKLASTKEKISES